MGEIWSPLAPNSQTDLQGGGRTPETCPAREDCFGEWQEPELKGDLDSNPTPGPRVLEDVESLGVLHCVWWPGFGGML